MKPSTVGVLILTVREQRREEPLQFQERLWRGTVVRRRKNKYFQGSENNECEGLRTIKP